MKYRFSVFLAAFLLFQVQLIIAKALLPGFTGSYLVWTACMIFCCNKQKYQSLIGDYRWISRQNKTTGCLLTNRYSNLLEIIRWSDY